MYVVHRVSGHDYGARNAFGRTGTYLFLVLQTGAQFPPPQPAEVVRQLKDVALRHLRT